jgi:hypothetical protein
MTRGAVKISFPKNTRLHESTRKSKPLLVAWMSEIVVMLHKEQYLGKLGHAYLVQGKAILFTGLDRP